jgi:hypothetical protein
VGGRWYLAIELVKFYWHIPLDILSSSIVSSHVLAFPLLLPIFWSSGFFCFSFLLSSFSSALHVSLVLQETLGACGTGREGPRERCPAFLSPAETRTARPWL